MAARGKMRASVSAGSLFIAALLVRLARSASGTLGMQESELCQKLLHAMGASVEQCSGKLEACEVGTKAESSELQESQRENKSLSLNGFEIGDEKGNSSDMDMTSHVAMAGGVRSKEASRFCQDHLTDCDRPVTWLHPRWWEDTITSKAEIWFKPPLSARVPAPARRAEFTETQAAGCGEVELQSSRDVESLQGCRAVKALKIGQGIVSLTGLESLEQVEGSLLIEKNYLLVNLSGLTNLTSVGSLSILKSSLTSLHGLENLRAVRGDVIIQENMELRSLSGLKGLERVGSSFVVRGSEAEAHLQTFAVEGLESLQRVGSLRIVALNITTLAGLSSLRFVRSTLTLAFCKLESLHGLALSTIGELRVNSLFLSSGCGANKPLAHEMQFLGGPFAANAAVGVFSVDGDLGPKCITKHEHKALVLAVAATSFSGIPKQKCTNRELVTSQCKKGHPCKFSLAAFSIDGDWEVVLSVFISGVSTGCGACPRDYLQSNVSNKTVDFGYDLRDEVVGWRSICLCGTLDNPERRGPVGEILLSGPKEGSPIVCHRGRNCTVRLDGEALEPTDHVVLMTGSCNRDPLQGFRATWIAGNEYALHDPATWYTALPRLYQVCWRAPCNFTADGPTCPAPEDKYFPAGSVELWGPHPGNQAKVLGEGSLTALNVGLGVVDGDRMRLMRICGQAAHEGGMEDLEVVSQNRQFDFGRLTEDRVGAGNHSLCWCSKSAKCDAAHHFTAESGTVVVQCPVRQEYVWSLRLCRDCPAGKQQLEPGFKPCSGCPTGRFSNESTRGCEPCEPRAFASMEGSPSCVPCKIWESTNRAATGCYIDLPRVLLLVAFPISLSALCVVLARIIGRQLSVVDVSVERDCTVIATLGPHGFSNFGRASFPATLRNTGHPGLDKPSQPFCVRVRDAAHLELLRRPDSPIKTRMDTSKGTLVVAFPYDLYHQGWPVPAPLLLLVLLMTVVALSVLVWAAGLALEASIGAAATALVCTTAAVIVRRRESVTPLTRRLSEFQQELMREKIFPTRAAKGAGRALAVGKLHKLLDFFRQLILDRNAYYLTSNILVLLTKSTQLSYAELVGPGQVEWFVSHYWGTAFEHFCTALQKHAEAFCGSSTWEEVNYWVCFCSNNQHKIEEELGGGRWQDSSFYVTLQSGQCRGTCMVLDDKALPLTRVWCIFELLQTVKLQRNSEDFEGLLLCSSSGVLNTGAGSAEVALALAARVADMNLATAEATSEEDKNMIQKQVIEEMGSFNALNGFVSDAVSQMLLRARQNADGRFATVLKHLEP